MKDLFDLHRFWLLLKKTVMERPLQIFGSFGLTIVSTTIVYFALKDTSWEWSSFQRGTFAVGFVVGGGYLAATVFTYFSNSSKGFSYLTLPASTFEKWLCGMVILAGFTLFYHVFFRLLDATNVAQFRSNYDSNSILYQYASVLPFDDTYLFFVYKTYFNLIGVMALAALYFNKNAIIKGALLFLGLLYAGMGINGLIGKLFFGSNTPLTGGRPFFNISTSDRLVVMPENWLYPIDMFFLIGLPAILWLIVFVRLREKEF
jgi:hypothetical protein